MIDFTEEQIKRYSRHIILPEIGGVGQSKLLESSVLVVGAGGLGSPLLLYLAAAGVGRIGIIDFDRVDISNLQRQIIHTTDDIGKNKAISAKERIESLNPDVKVEIYTERMDISNCLDIIGSYDIVVDGTDNFPTRYLMNDACLKLQKTFVFASIFRFEAQVTTFKAYEGPCYRCLYPEPPPPGTVPSCSQAGVMGVLPGIAGSLQAIEVIKLITGIGTPLIGRLLLIDTLSMEFTELKFAKDPDCPSCSKDPEEIVLEGYEDLCMIGPAREKSNETGAIGC